MNEAETDAVDADPVKQYYEDKKQRYLREMRGAASEMKTGTPFDWEDAARYEDASADDDAKDAKKEED
ncbi:MAG TPA: hypothetical protein VLA56_03520 [Pseudomonadales bacterium]|nr:hypothetical protein [Pseudomonadales bacterium]